MSHKTNIYVIIKASREHTNHCKMYNEELEAEADSVEDAGDEAGEVSRREICAQYVNKKKTIDKQASITLDAIRRTRKHVSGQHNLKARARSVKYVFVDTFLVPGTSTIEGAFKKANSSILAIIKQHAAGGCETCTTIVSRHQAREHM